jgi:hypothetical protein
MTSADQLPMFEPQGQDLAKLAVFHLGAYERESRVADSLAVSGFASASRSRVALAAVAFDRAVVCEVALQFETLAGLS